MAQQFRLPDGRNLDYHICGAPNGFPLVFIHGTPGSYSPDPGLAAICEQKDVKLITFSRAGYGGSDRNKGRRVIDSVADTRALLDHLGVEQCLAAGWSGGGPHVLACAARLEGCLAALCVAGTAPFDAEGLDFLAGQGEDNIAEFHAALKGEKELRKFCDDARPEILKADAAAIIEALSSLLPDVDKAAMLDDPQMGQHVASSMAEAMRVSSDGWIDDDLEMIAPWGFELSEIKVPVLLYQGSEDKMVPYNHGQWLAEHLPPAKLEKHFLQGEGHISIFLGHANSMIDELRAKAK